MQGIYMCVLFVIKIRKERVNTIQQFNAFLPTCVSWKLLSALQQKSLICKNNEIMQNIFFSSNRGREKAKERLDQDPGSAERCWDCDTEEPGDRGQQGSNQITQEQGKYWVKQLVIALKIKVKSNGI